jgi:hypothetical protein
MTQRATLATLPAAVISAVLAAVLTVSLAVFATEVRASGAPRQTQTLYCGLWRVDSGFVSTARIKNVLITSDLSISPVIYLADGTAYQLPQLNLGPGGIADLSINDALNAAPSQVRAHLSDFGSLGLSFTAKSPANAAASMQVLNLSQSLVFVAPFLPLRTMQMPPAEYLLEAMWWKHDSGVSPFAAISNTSLVEKDATVEVLGSGGTVRSRSLSLGPRNTQILDLAQMLLELPDSEQQTGGIRIRYLGQMGDIVASGGLLNQSEGYSASIEFHFGSSSHASPTSVSLAGIGLMVGSPPAVLYYPGTTRFSAYAAIRNTTNRELDVTPALFLMKGDQPSKLSLPVERLGPRESRQLDMTSQLSDYSGLVTPTFTFDGSRSDLLIATGSVDQTGSFVFGMLPDNLAESWAKVAPVWLVADGFDTMFTVFNPKEAPEDIVVTLSYEGGTGHYAFPVYLAPGASKLIDMAALIEGEQPDSEGNVIPEDVQEGSATFAGPEGISQPIRLGLSTGTFNVHTATCGSSCNICTTTTDVNMNPDPVQTPVGTSEQMSVKLELSDGTTVDKTSSAVWSSQNTAIATVSKGSVRGVAVGTTNIVATVALAPGGGDGEPVPECPSSCPMGTEIGEGPATVVPTVTFNSNTPNFVLVGTSPSITVFNLQQVMGSPTGGTYAWSGSPSGLSFSPNNSSTADVSTLTATSQSASLNDTTLTVNYTLNGMSAKTPATRQITKSKFAFLGNPPTMVAAPIGSGNFGYLYNVTYTVFTDPGQQQLQSGYSDIAVTEVVTQNGAACSGCITGPGSTNANSQIVDVDGIVAAAALPPGFSRTVTQTITLGGVLVRNNTVTFTTAVAIVDNGPFQ